MTAATAHPTPDYCLNCHTQFTQPRRRFCGGCGQESDLHPPSVHEFVHEYVGHYVALEGPLWRSLWALILLPGQLTLEYFRGRRRRYVLPLRIYLSASFVFFIGLHLLPAGLGTAHIQLQDKPAVSIDGVPSDWRHCLDDRRADCDWLAAEAARGLHKLEQLDSKQWLSRLSAMAPYGMLLMQPVFAALLLLCFTGSGRRYAEHFVFSLHIHAFWYLALLGNAVLASSASKAVGLLILAHGLLALRRVYQRSWPSTLGRGLLLALSYLLCLALGVVALTLVAALRSA